VVQLLANTRARASGWSSD